MNIIKMNHKIKKKIKNAQDEQLLPWTTDDHHLASIILESKQMQPMIFVKKQTDASQQMQEEVKIVKDYQSFNFYNNLRKYENKKGVEFRLNKDRNFIERNKNGFKDYESAETQKDDKNMMVKIIQEYKRKKSLVKTNNPIPSGQMVNWSVIMYMEDGNKKARKHRDLNGFMNFQSSRKQSSKVKRNTRNSENQEENKYQIDKYQKLLKVRENLRRRNLKSSQKSRNLYNSLNIIQKQVSPSKHQKTQRSLWNKYATLANRQAIDNFFHSATDRAVAKTSQSPRKRKTIQEQMNSLCDSTISIQEYNHLRSSKGKEVNAIQHKNRHILNIQGSKFITN